MCGTILINKLISLCPEKCVDTSGTTKILVHSPHNIMVVAAKKPKVVYHCHLRFNNCSIKQWFTTSIKTQIDIMLHI